VTWLPSLDAPKIGFRWKSLGHKWNSFVAPQCRNPLSLGAVLRTKWSLGIAALSRLIKTQPRLFSLVNSASSAASRRVERHEKKVDSLLHAICYRLCVLPPSFLQVSSSRSCFPLTLHSHLLIISCADYCSANYLLALVRGTNFQIGESYST